MRFRVSIWKFADSSSAEIRTWVDASDPVAAALSLSLMARLGLGRAALVTVYHEHRAVGEFEDLEVSMPLSPLDCAVSYDYGLP